MLPIIDIEKFRSGSEADRAEIARAIGLGCEQTGFLYVKNHGIPESVIENALDAAKSFFAEHEDKKIPLKRPFGRYRGYIPMSHFSSDRNGQPLVLYEAFLQGLDIDTADPVVTETNGVLSANLWPENPVFQEAAKAYWDAVSALSADLLEAFALALGLERHAFSQHFEKPISNISYLHYPPRPDIAKQKDRPDPKSHRDTNALTILLPDPVGGLQVEMPDGSWIEAQPIEGTFIVNIGNMMELWSGGRFKSTMHRVNPPPGIERYSIGYFAVPDFDTVISPLVPMVSNIDTELPASIHAGEDLAGFIASCDDMATA